MALSYYKTQHQKTEHFFFSSITFITHQIMNFETACKKLETLASQQKLSNQNLLSLYGLYKQGMEGDCNSSRPSGFFQEKQKAKYDAWKNLQGLPRDIAKQNYIDKIKSFESNL